MTKNHTSICKRIGTLENQLSCSTLTFRDLSLVDAFDRIRGHNFKYVNIAVVLPFFCPHFDPIHASDKDVQDLIISLKNFQLTPISLDIVPGYFNSHDPSKVERFVKRSIEVGSQIGAQFISIPAGAVVEASIRKANIYKVKPYITEMADYAQERKMELSIEAPHFATLVEDVNDAVEFFDIIDDARVKCTFDTSHVTRKRQSSLVSALDKIGPARIALVHLRDSLKEDISLTPGKGQADFLPFINELRRADFGGYLVFELENEGYSTRQKERELDFAASYIGNIFQKGNISFYQKVVGSSIYQLIERTIRSPKAEIKRHSHLHDIAQKSKRFLYGFSPIRTYEGIWKKRWRLRRNRVIEDPPRSVTLARQSGRIVKVAIVGCGWAGSKMQGPAFRRLREIKIVGTADKEKTRASEAAKRLECNYYTDFEEMVAKEKPDLVSVCTREWQHYEPAIALLKNGVDVFCEKLMASRFQHGVEMVEAAKRNGKVLAVNYNYRFIPGIQKIKEIIRKNILGRLAFIDIKVHAFSYHHALDLVSFLGGRIKSVSAYYNNDDSIRDFGGTDWSQYDENILYIPSVNLAATFLLSDDAVATVNASYFLNPLGFILSVDTVFEHGAVTLTGLNMFDTVGTLSYTTNRTIKHFDWNHKKNVFAKGYEYTFQKSIESLVSAYLAGVAPETPGIHGLFIMALERAVSESCLNNSKVDVSNFIAEIDSSYNVGCTA